MKQTDTIIRSATVINEGIRRKTDVWIRGERIWKIGSFNPEEFPQEATVISGAGKYLFPGIIDEHVHFREPGATHKGDMATESLCAAAGGVTTCLDMPNNTPAATSVQQLEEKIRRAAGRSWTNYGFYLGLTNGNVDEALQLDRRRFPGIKIFMGSSTGNMLVDRKESIRRVFREYPGVVALHCEDEGIVRQNTEKARTRYGEQVTFRIHPDIRSREACIRSTREAIAMAEECRARILILHVSTAEEVEMIAEARRKNPRIFAEACPHYLVFSSEDYDRLTFRLKCNPAVKEASDREALRQALREGILKTVGTDHAPHLLAEKDAPYFNSPSGMPGIQFAFPVMLELALSGIFSLETLAERMCHNPARLFGIVDRGFIREGYYADLVLVESDPEKAATAVRSEDCLGKCGWSPWEGLALHSRVCYTWINGRAAIADGKVVRDGTANGKALVFNPSEQEQSGSF